MKLEIYGKNADGKRIVVKTYEVDTYSLMLGPCEDIAAAIKLDDIRTGSDSEIIAAVGGLITGSMSTVKSLLKDIFEGLTDDELRNVKITDIAIVLVDVVKYTIEQIASGFKNAKN